MSILSNALRFQSLSANEGIAACVDRGNIHPQLFLMPAHDMQSEVTLFRCAEPCRELPEVKNAQVIGPVPHGQEIEYTCYPRAQYRLLGSGNAPYCWLGNVVGTLPKCHQSKFRYISSLKMVTDVRHMTTKEKSFREVVKSTMPS